MEIGVFFAGGRVETMRVDGVRPFERVVFTLPTEAEDFTVAPDPLANPVAMPPVVTIDVRRQRFARTDTRQTWECYVEASASKDRLREIWQGACGAWGVAMLASGLAADTYRRSPLVRSLEAFLRVLPSTR